jgi:hypothetical protein
MPLTTDPLDPRLATTDPETGLKDAYLVAVPGPLPRVRPLRRSYRHDACGEVTTMALAIAETYAVYPHYYGATYCATCKAHFPVAQFHWLDGEVVGS